MLQAVLLSSKLFNVFFHSMMLLACCPGLLATSLLDHSKFTAWRMDTYDAENLMLRHNATFPKNTIIAASNNYTLRGFVDPITMGSTKRSFCSYVCRHDELVSEDDVPDEISLRRVEKKKRLTAEQVKSLEMSFAMENKLEPDRKQKLANDLGLEPRQVGIWFQNRRARWKTKKLEQEYDSLKSQYAAVLLERETLQAQLDRLTKQLETKVQNNEVNTVEEKHGEGSTGNEGPLRKDDSDSKSLNKAFQCDTCNEKGTSLYSDQTDMSSPFQCDTIAPKDHRTVYWKITNMETIPSSSSQNNRYAFEQIGQKTEESFLVEDQYYLGVYTGESYDVPWLWLT